MRVDLTRVQKFFENYLYREDMPRAVRELTLKGHVVQHGSLETCVVEAKQLDTTILEHIKFPTEKHKVPILYLSDGRYIAYDPTSGKRLTNRYYDFLFGGITSPH